MHTNTNSKIASWEPPSPHRPEYYVQSPPRDSHDGEKIPLTPILSPVASPDRYARISSSTRYSGYFKPRSPNITIGSTSRRVGNQFDAVERETSDDGEGQRQCCFQGLVAGFVLLLTFFALGLWGVSKHQKPVVIMKSIEFKNFVIQAGGDASGVNTEMVTLNSTVTFLFRNTAGFFKLHVSTSPLDLSFRELILATGSIDEFSQLSKSERTLEVTVEGSEVPVYGGGADLRRQNVEGEPVPLTSSLRIRAYAHILGRLVKPIYHIEVQCSVNMDSKNMNVAIPLSNQCIYN